jgi:uncharacterized LabA/DUF88 family protein
MHFYPNERVVLLVDGKDLSAAQRDLDFVIDFKMLLALFRSRAHLVRAMYYTTIVVQEQQPLRPLVDWLEYNGFYLVTKPVNEVYDSDGRRHVRGDTRVELAVDAMDLADSTDHFVLFSGNASYRAMVAALQRRGKRVSVVSTMRTSPQLISDELRRQSDQFIELAELKPLIARPPLDDRQRERPVREPEVSMAPAAALADAADDALDDPVHEYAPKPERAVIVEKRAPRRPTKR